MNRGSNPFPPANTFKALERLLSEAFLFVGDFVAGSVPRKLRLVGGVKGHNKKGCFLSGKPSHAGEELHITRSKTVIALVLWFGERWAYLRVMAKSL